MINDRRIKTSLIAIGADIVLTVIKFALALVTGSAALLADAYHSATDFIVSLILLCGIVVRRQQEKKNSEQGIRLARRIESMLAIAVALIILYVPVEIVRAIRGNEAQILENVWVGIAGMLVVIALVFFMAKLKTYVGKETDSPALEADGYHSLVDLFSSFAVLFSLVGFMVGIYLDNVIAILIAVMIGLSGIELLMSGIRSLVKGTDFDQLSLFETLAALVHKLPVGKRITRTSWHAIRTTLRYKHYLIGVIVSIYGLSGFQQVPHGYLGIKQYFNQHIGEPLVPGLHYSIPWPLGRIALIADQELMSITVGSETNLPSSLEHKMWKEIKESRVLTDETSYLVTGDENLVAIHFTLQFRLSKPAQTSIMSDDISTIVRMFSEMTLADSTRTLTFDQIGQTSHWAFADDIAVAIKRQLAAIDIDITIVDAQIQSLQPPAMVVNSYRDVLTADQEKQQRINRAVAQRLNDLPVANAEVVTQTATVKATSNENLKIAEGDVMRMMSVADTYKFSPNAFAFNHYINSFTNTLRDKRLIIADPKIAHEDVRNWVLNNQDKRK
ncbi:cation diffusion facilitator family transporter [Agaribacter marinus]|nr:cation diffusion facilitator family transporter [Agaribacter marinus]